MEDRMMLSATAPDFASANISSVQFTLQLHSPPALEASIEGGFIPISNIAHVTPLDGRFSTSGTSLSDAALQKLITRGTLVASVNAETLQLFGSGVSPVLFGPNMDAGFIPGVHAVKSGQSGNESNDSEGGSIPIASILARVGSLEPRAPGEQVSENIADDPADAPRTSARRAGADKTPVSAEWARAMAFELDGGERISSTPAADRERKSTESQAKSLQGGLVARHSRVSSEDLDAAHRSHEELRTASAGPVDAVSDRLSPGISDQPQLKDVAILPAKSAAHHTPQSPMPAIEPAQDAVDAMDSSRGEALAEFGGNEKWKLHWLTFYSKPALTASPLLLVLALERVRTRGAASARPARRDA